MLSLLKSIRDTPSILKQCYPEMVNTLHKLTDKKGQGSGNKPTDQEACFAVEAMKHGFRIIGKNEKVEDMCLQYQPNGTQQSIDFRVYEPNRMCDIDLKHSNGKTFYWNDGWFEDNVVYIISYTVKKNNRVYIGFGHETPSDDDKKAMDELVLFKKKFNTENKNSGFLRKYLRFANQYSCDQFTDEFSSEKFISVQKFLE